MLSLFYHWIQKLRQLPYLRLSLLNALSANKLQILCGGEYTYLASDPHKHSDLVYNELFFV